MKKSFSILKHLMSLFILVFVMTGCDMMNVGVKDFLMKYTETAAVEVVKFNGTYDFDASGKRCLSCQRDQSVTLMLRNPQKYQLDIQFKLDNPNWEIIKGRDYFVTTNSDCTEVSFSFDKDFLNGVEWESGGGFNLNGNITLLEPASGRYFDEFRIEWNDNSTPPAVENLLLNLTQADSGNYVLCFFMPEISANVPTSIVHLRDTKKLVITENGTEKIYYFRYDTEVEPAALTFYIDSSMTAVSTDIVQTPSGFQNLTGLSSVQPVFSNITVPPETRACYHEVTSCTPSTDREDKFSVKIIDDAGLYSDVKISNKASKLKPVTFNVDNDQTYGAAELSNTKTILFNHDLQDEDGNYVDSVTIEYKVYLSNDGTNYFLEQSGSLVRNMAVTPSIELPPAKNYKIEAYARKDYYVKSDTKDVKFNVSRSPNYYISQSGNDDIIAGGTLLKPYYSINKCVSEIIEEIDNYGINSAGYNIYLLTNLTVDENEDFYDGNHMQNAFAWFEYDSRIAAKATEVNPFKLTISGYNGNKTINFNRNSTNRGMGLYFEYNKNTEYILNNLTLTGAYHNQKGAVVFLSNHGYGLSDPVTTTDCQLTLINTTITGNTIERIDTVDYPGAGLYFEGPGKLNLSGAVKIYNNKIINNFGFEDETTNANNLYIGVSAGNSGVQNRVTIKGSLAGSNIGIRTAERPGNPNSPAIPFTSGYGYKAGGLHAGINPETYFTGDLDFIGFDELTGEACVEIDHGTVAGDGINEIQSYAFNSQGPFTKSDKPRLVIKNTSDVVLSESDLDSISVKIMDNLTVVKDVTANGTKTLTLDLSNCIFGEAQRTYSVEIIFVYNGQGYSQTLDLTVRN